MTAVVIVYVNFRPWGREEKLIVAQAVYREGWMITASSPDRNGCVDNAAVEECEPVGCPEISNRHLQRSASECSRVDPGERAAISRARLGNNPPPRFRDNGVTPPREFQK